MTDQVVYWVPTVQIDRRGFGYEVQVITERLPGGGGYGWTGWAPTCKSAERLAQRILERGDRD